MNTINETTKKVIVATIETPMCIVEKTDSKNGSMFRSSA
jgi:hypothetical protein